MPAIVVLGLVLRFGVAFALRWLWIITVGAVLGWLAGKFLSVNIGRVHPLAGIGRGIIAVNRDVTNALDRATLASEAAATQLFLAVGHQLERAGAELAGFAVAVVASVTGVVVQVPKTAEKIAKATVGAAVVGLLADTVRKLTVAVQGIGRRVGTLERSWRTQLSTFARGIDRIRSRTIPAIRTTVGRVTARVGRLERRVASRSWWQTHIRAIAGTAAFAAAVGVALRRMGLNWLRCPSLGRVGRKVGCGGFAFLEALMFLPLVAIGLREMCSLVKPIQQVALAFEPLLIAFVSEVQGFVCGGREAAPTAMEDSDFQYVTRLPSALEPEDLEPLTLNRLAA